MPSLPAPTDEWPHGPPGTPVEQPDGTWRFVDTRGHLQHYGPKTIELARWWSGSVGSVQAAAEAVGMDVSHAYAALQQPHVLALIHRWMSSEAVATRGAAVRSVLSALSPGSDLTTLQKARLALQVLEHPAFSATPGSSGNAGQGATREGGGYRFVLRSTSSPEGAQHAAEVGVEVLEPSSGERARPGAPRTGSDG